MESFGLYWQICATLACSGSPYIRVNILGSIFLVPLSHTKHKMRVKEKDGTSVRDVEKTELRESVTNNSTRKTSFFKTTFNAVNTLAGVGIMSIPYAVSSGGWLSLILLFAIAITTYYTGLLIKRCMDGDPSITSYPDIGDKAFGTKGRLLISVSIHLELFLIATGFLILAGDNLHKLFPNLENNVLGVRIGGERSFIVLTALIVLPTVWINKMTTLSYISATGIFAYMVILGSVLWSALFDGVGFHQKGVIMNWRGLPTACSLYTMCYHAHSVFPTLYTSSKNQGQFHMVLLVGFLFSTLTYVSMAILGYLMFGSEVQSQITLSLPTKSFSSKVAIFTALVNPIAKYPLLLKPIVETIESHFQTYCKRRSYSLLARTILVGISATVAVTLPYFGYLMSLIGAFFSVTASILLPCICYLKISRAYRKIGFELAIISFIMPMGIVILVLGTYISMSKIIHSL